MPAMVDTFLVPEATTVTAKGDGPVVEVGAAANRVFLLQLNITRILEQQALDVSIFGSADGNTWGQKDRKSTRLKSSHPSISYAVFCLKKKTNGDQPLLRYGLGVGLDGHRWRPFDRGSTRRLE